MMIKIAYRRHSGDQQIVSGALSNILERRRGATQIDRSALQWSSLYGLSSLPLDRLDPRDALGRCGISLQSNDKAGCLAVRRQKHLQPPLEIRILKSRLRQIERIIDLGGVKTRPIAPGSLLFLSCCL